MPEEMQADYFQQTEFLNYWLFNDVIS